MSRGVDTVQPVTFQVPGGVSGYFRPSRFTLGKRKEVYVTLFQRSRDTVSYLLPVLLGSVPTSSEVSSRQQRCPSNCLALFPF